MEPQATTTSCVHVVAMPYPGRGHINPMLNLCNLMATRCPDSLLITFIVTEEWLSLLSSEPKPPPNFRFRTIPNVIPSEKGRAKDFPGFIRAALTMLEAPVERLIDQLETQPSVIIHDMYLRWVIGVGNRRNIPVASFWSMSATVFSMFHHYDLLVRNGHQQVNLAERGEEWVDYIPGLPPTRFADFPTPFYGKGKELLDVPLDSVSWVSKAHYILLTSVYELEDGVIDALKSEFQIPIYSIGPAIPYFNIGEAFSPINGQEETYYVSWLDSQPENSVLYISQGSFLSVSSSQLDEIIAGVHDSGIRYLWVARGEAERFRAGDGDKGLVVPWCDQLKVLCHSSIGGFWSHCGWNSTKEGAFAGAPMLTFPIFWDQVPNSKIIVEDWKSGWRVKKRDVGVETLVTREEIAGLVQRFMDLESVEGKEMRRRAKELKEICRRATAEGGSSETDIDAFVKDISYSQFQNH